LGNRENPARALGSRARVSPIDVPILNVGDDRYDRAEDYDSSEVTTFKAGFTRSAQMRVPEGGVITTRGLLLI
jgi:hypothetical protein